MYRITTIPYFQNEAQQWVLGHSLSKEGFETLKLLKANLFRPTAARDRESKDLPATGTRAPPKDPEGSAWGTARGGIRPARDGGKSSGRGSGSRPPKSDSLVGQIEGGSVGTSAKR